MEAEEKRHQEDKKRRMRKSSLHAAVESFASFMGTQLRSQNKDDTKTNQIRCELENYLSAVIPSKYKGQKYVDNPLKYWKKRGDLVNLQEYAAFTFSKVATQIGAENTFKRASLTKNKLRNQLSNETLTDLLQCNEHRQMMDFKILWLELSLFLSP